MTPSEHPFDSPWQAQLFALTIALNEAGHFTWAEWAAVFGPKVQTTSEAFYWEVWSSALIDLLEQKGVTDRVRVDALKSQWQASARATPHGQPIVLQDKPA